MMNDVSRRFRTIPAMTFYVAIAACHSAPTRIYSLYAMSPSVSAAAYAGPAVRVDTVNIPPALDRMEVVTDVAPGELKVSDLDHWSAPLGQMAKNALSADLIARLPPGRVIFPHLAKPAGTLGLSVDILDFKSDADRAVLDASWAYTADAGAAGPPASARFTVPARDRTAATTAHSMSALLSQLADRIVAGIPAQGAP